MRLPSQPNSLIVTSIAGLVLAALNLNPMPASSVASAAANPDSVNPCKLVTAAEAQSALGMPVSAGVFMDDNIFRHCTFTGTTETGSGKPYVTVSLISKDKATFDKMNLRDFERATGTTLDAFFYKRSPWVTVWHNGNELQIQISFNNDAGEARAKTEELKLAESAVTRF
jgi:hypothetical protein